MASTDKKYDRMLASRRRRNLKKKLLLSLKILLLAIFFVALVWGFNYFYNSNYFKIKSINVSGNNYYSIEEIKKEADVALGLNIFEIDKKSIEDMLVKSLVRLKSASLKKIFPDRIEIQVGEREQSSLWGKILYS
jgi:cell division protein FtsQ